MPELYDKPSAKRVFGDDATEEAPVEDMDDVEGEEEEQQRLASIALGTDDPARIEAFWEAIRSYSESVSSGKV